MKLTLEVELMDLDTNLVLEDLNVAILEHEDVTLHTVAGVHSLQILNLTEQNETPTSEFTPQIGMLAEHINGMWFKAYPVVRVFQLEGQTFVVLDKGTALVHYNQRYLHFKEAD